MRDTGVMIFLASVGLLDVSEMIQAALQYYIYHCTAVKNFRSETKHKEHVFGVPIFSHGISGLDSSIVIDVKQRPYIIDVKQRPRR